MLSIKFAQLGEGCCSVCGDNANNLLKAVVSSDNKSKEYVVCHNCGLKLKKQVDNKNSEIEGKNKANNSTALNVPSKPVNNVDFTPTEPINIRHEGDNNTPYNSSSAFNQYNNQGIQSVGTMDTVEQPRNVFNQYNPIMQKTYNNQIQPQVMYQNNNQYNQNFAQNNTNKNDIYLYQKYGPEKFEKYKKLGGWLKFFCISQALSVLINFGQLVLNWIDGILNPVGIAFVAVFAASAFFVCKLCKSRDFAFLKIFEIQQIAFLFLSIVIGIISSMFTDSNDSTDLTSNFTGFFVYYFNWINYFARSERCEVFFGGKEFLLSGIFAKHEYLSSLKKSKQKVYHY